MEISPQEQNTPTAPLPSEQGQSEVIQTGDGRIALRFVPSDSFNPYTCETEINRLLSCLIYENLLTISEAFAAEPGVCDRWECDESGCCITLYLRENAMFSDGSRLTAEDVVYSLLRARGSDSGFVGRLSSVDTVIARNESTVEITLRSPNPNFALRLDIPIVKQDTGKDAIPVGSGPMVPDAGLLIQNPYYCGTKTAPAKQVYLESCSDVELTDALNSGKLDLLLADPDILTNMGSFTGISRHTVPTTICSYLLVNTDSGSMADADRRRLINSMLDRNELGKVLCGEPTLLPIHPDTPEYNPETAEKWLFSDIAEACIRVLTEDYDGDGMLEYFSDGVPMDFTLTLLACSENRSSTAAAKYIADTLQSFGVSVTLNLLPEREFFASQQKGSYDLCLLSMRLTTDFDLTGLVSQTDDDVLVSLAAAFSTKTGEERTEAASLLADYFCEKCMVMPLVFQYRVLFSGEEAPLIGKPTWTEPYC